MTNARVFHNNKIHNNEIHNNERTPERESACKGSGREYVCLERERGRVYRERERERETERQRERDGKCEQREGRSVFLHRGSVWRDRKCV